MRDGIRFILAVLPFAWSGCGTAHGPDDPGVGEEAPLATSLPPIAAHTIPLAPGLAVDPMLVSDAAGGPLEAEGLDGSCRGRITVTPTIILELSQPSRVQLVVSAPQDTTLVLQRDDGTFACNDDDDGLNPALDLQLSAGSHRAWVGVYNDSDIGSSFKLGLTTRGGLTSNAVESLTPGAGDAISGSAIRSSAIPRECGMDEARYGSIVVGQGLVLRRHAPYSGPNPDGSSSSEETNFVQEMEPFVGQRTTVTRLSGVDESGCPGVRVAADDSEHFWRIRDQGWE